MSELEEHSSLDQQQQDKEEQNDDAEDVQQLEQEIEDENIKDQPNVVRKIMITAPEEIYDRVPRVRTRPHKISSEQQQHNEQQQQHNEQQKNPITQSQPNFSSTAPIVRARSARTNNANNNISGTNNRGNRNTLNNSQKVVIVPPPSSGGRSNARGNRNGLSSTLPLSRGGRPGSSRTTSTDSLILSQPMRTYTLTPELESLKKQAIEQEPLEVEDNSVLEDLLLLLSEERRQFAAQHQFKESQRRNEAIGYVMECQAWLQKLEVQRALSQDVEQQQEANVRQEEEFDTETAQLRHRLKKKLRRKREKLVEEQEKEARELTEFWASEPKTRLYNRSSNTLICLRRQLAILLTQCRFTDAEEVEAQVEARQKLEERENHETMQREFNEVFNKMRTRQSEDLQYFDSSADMELRKLSRRREKLREALANRERKIEMRSDTAKDPNKVWNSTQISRTSEVANTTARATMPSLKVAKSDINDQQVQKLSLPPLTVPKYDPKKNAAKEEEGSSTAGKKAKK